MRLFASTLLAVFALALVACGSSKPVKMVTRAQVYPASYDVRLRAKDGVTVFARAYSPAPDQPPKATILLFHQAGSGKGEYETIAPRLTAAGYDALAIDQRSGGALFGENQTVKALGQSADYLAVQADLQAAIDWARGQKRPIILWGSSYSSSLVFPMAVKNPDLKAILAFSPGEYFDDKTLVERAAAKVAVPVYITSASKPDEIEAASSIAHAVPRGLAAQYVPRAGVHGSSTLIADKDPQGAEANWVPVMAFLKKVAP